MSVDYFPPEMNVPRVGAEFRQLLISQMYEHCI